MIFFPYLFFIDHRKTIFQFRIKREVKIPLIQVHLMFIHSFIESYPSSRSGKQPSEVPSSRELYRRVSTFPQPFAKSYPFLEHATVRPPRHPLHPTCRNKNLFLNTMLLYYLTNITINFVRVTKSQLSWPVMCYATPIGF